MTRLGKLAQLFINDSHGHFREQGHSWRVDVRDTTGAAFGDYDNDGRPDLFVARDHGGDILFHNNGNGYFTNVTRVAGIADTAPGTSVAWGDFNNDGHLDLYVASYISCVGKWTTPYTLTSTVHYTRTRCTRTTATGRSPTRHRFFAGRQLEAPASRRPGSTTAATTPISTSETTSSARTRDHNHLWQNNGSAGGGASRFTDVSAPSGTDFFMNTMGIAAADLEHDGRLDLALSNIGSNKLLHNNGDGTFTDIASAAGVARPLQTATTASVTWGVGAYDFNLDGWQDLYFAAGNVLKSLDKRGGPQPNELYVNDGTGKHSST